VQDTSIDIELVVDAHASTGECPTWSEREQALYWVDIEEPALHRFDPKTGADRRWIMPSQIGSFALCRSGAVLAALRTGLIKVRIPEGTSEHLVIPPYDPRTYRFNDGKCDAAGRFWVGVMHKPLPNADGQREPQESAQLQVFDKDGLRPVQARAVIPNGLAWSPDQRTLYFTDSRARLVRAFDFDPDAGAIVNPRALVQFTEDEGEPDGAAMDVEGYYWCALYGGSRIVRVAPDGRVDREIRLPVSQPTMCAFGGADLDVLYITSASNGLDAEARRREPAAGGLFRCRPGVRGVAPHLFAD
jgi:sugar lactone lactonase YvrE